MYTKKTWVSSRGYDQWRDCRPIYIWLKDVVKVLDDPDKDCFSQTSMIKRHLLLFLDVRYVGF